MIAALIEPIEIPEPNPDVDPLRGLSLIDTA